MGAGGREGDVIAALRCEDVVVTVVAGVMLAAVAGAECATRERLRVTVVMVLVDTIVHVQKKKVETS